MFVLLPVFFSFLGFLLIGLYGLVESILYLIVVIITELVTRGRFQVEKKQFFLNVLLMILVRAFFLVIFSILMINETVWGFLRNIEAVYFPLFLITFVFNMYVLVVSLQSEKKSSLSVMKRVLMFMPNAVILVAFIMFAISDIKV
ncbi:hypothetical protein QTG56_25410 (plasmid) [Rossellomorea sp. AcN35-11]|nr:hypothetical protein [Rossellomorea aquimaris]WJV31955.1 hypothetical protein QTG56_25410 [Rossellomorea sp. AcN35-11]